MHVRSEVSLFVLFLETCQMLFLRLLGSEVLLLLEKLSGDDFVACFVLNFEH